MTSAPTVYGPASQAQIAAATQRHRHHHRWLWAIGAFVLAIVVLNGLAQAASPAPPCKHSCTAPPPPTSPAVSYASRYHSSTYGFSLAYDSGYAGTPTTQGSGSISWHFALKSGGYLDAEVTGSRGQSAQQAVAAAQSASFGQFKEEYFIPAAEVGYVPGSGAVYEGQWSPLIGSSATERLAISAASHNGVTVTVVCEAPKTSDAGGHPDPSQLGIGADQFCDDVANTVVWPR